MKKIGCASPLNLIALGVNLAIASPADCIAFPAIPTMSDGVERPLQEQETEVATETQKPPVSSEEVQMGYEKWVIENGSPLPPINQVTPVSELQLSDVKPTEANSENLDSSLEREIDAEDGLIEPGMEQVTSVSQLSDVRPTDWAYQALATLVQRYGCIVGYPDSTYRGNRAMTRYEFAAGLNACLNRISEIIGNNRGGGVNTGDLDTLRKLQAEFRNELSNLQAKTDSLEERIVFQENTQFSTTTTLSATVEMSLLGGFGDKKAAPSGQTLSQNLELNTVFAGRSVINFDTSFTGRDLLRTSRAAGSVDPFERSVTGTDMTALGFGLDNDNNIGTNAIFYRFPLGDKGVVHFGASGISARTIMPALNPTISISRFGSGNPIYGLAGGGGLGIYYRFSGKLAAGLQYSGGTNSIANPNAGNGLFNGQYTAFSQVTFTPSSNLGIAFNYAHYYSHRPNLTGSTGSDFAQRPFGRNTATSANAFGLQGQYRFTTGFSMGAWVEYVNARAASSFRVNSVNGTKGDEADIWNWAITAAFQDVGRRGSQLGFVFGIPPKLTNNDFSRREDKDTAYHIEAFYRYRYNDRIFITPSILLITNPEHNNDNNDIWIVSLRTSFTF